jgi:hypothetical protein
VRATSRQHEKVREFIAQVSTSASRQVLIEATVVEVLLNDNYQSGVDWSALGINGLGYSFRQNFTGTNLSEAPFFSVSYSNPNAAAGGNISSTVKLLDSFGTTRVLSSPKIMALNNQTAVLKVVDNRVYFTIQAQVTPAQGTTQPLVVFTHHSERGARRLRDERHAAGRRGRRRRAQRAPDGLAHHRVRERSQPGSRARERGEPSARDPVARIRVGAARAERPDRGARRPHAGQLRGPPRRIARRSPRFPSWATP